MDLWSVQTVSFSSCFFFVSVFFLSVSVSWPLLVGLHVDLTLLHSCAFLYFVTLLVYALDHRVGSKLPQNRVAFVMVVERG